ncbi:PREDICTED: translation initiation factor IF-2-like isoform X1 [Chinchilla lanigera]|uniref:translation initiation factor IF-2-like isoform X1 n=1 Tax=Chinchilla lanigera TaxID=34839 RepID=UPI000698A0F3|nr:PREDICTED: translation initiation factor IF-2-like isoform X1 [Chinchilla lanigera]
MRNFPPYIPGPCFSRISRENTTIPRIPETADFSSRSPPPACPPQRPAAPVTAGRAPPGGPSCSRRVRAGTQGGRHTAPAPEGACVTRAGPSREAGRGEGGAGRGSEVAWLRLRRLTPPSGNRGAMGRGSEGSRGGGAWGFLAPFLRILQPASARRFDEGAGRDGTGRDGTGRTVIPVSGAPRVLSERAKAAACWGRLFGKGAGLGCQARGGGCEHPGAGLGT